MILLNAVFPWPPSTNNYVSTNGRQRYLNKRVREYRQNMLTMVNKIYNFDIPKHYKQITMQCRFHPPSKRKYDTSNFIKQLEDALMYTGIIDDDSQVYAHELYKFDKNPNIKGVYVVIKTVEPEIVKAMQSDIETDTQWFTRARGVMLSE